MVWTMRALLIYCFAAMAFGVVASEKVEPTPSLDDLLVQEVNGDFDEPTLPGSDQIRAAEKRFIAYMLRAESKAQKNEIYETFEFVSARIMERLKEKLQEIRAKAERDSRSEMPGGANDGKKEPVQR